MRERLVRAGVRLLLVLAVAAPAWSATLEVTVRDENGESVGSTPVVLTRYSRPGGFTIDAFRLTYGETDRGGRAVFENVPEGRYTVDVAGAASALFVRPGDNPVVPLPVITVPAVEDRVAADIEIWRGFSVVCRVTAEGDPMPGALVRFREIDRGLAVEMPMGREIEAERRLVAGRWNASVEPVAGYLLVDVDVNGRPIAGHEALLDLHATEPTAHVEWSYAAPAAVLGRVTFAAEPFAVEVVATLLEPGPWIDAVQQRGGSIFRQVSAGVDPRTGEYDMVVPDGLWEVRPAGAELESSDPETVEVQLDSGDDRRQDFLVRGGYGDSTRMWVEVRSPDGEGLGGAWVEVRPLDPPSPGGEPLARAESKYLGIAVLRGIGDGDYTITATHPDFVEGRTEVPGFDPDDRDNDDRIVVRLRRGATVHGISTDDDGQRVPGARLSLTRLGDGDEMPIDEPEARGDGVSEQAETDATGHAWLRGVPPGLYRLDGAMRGPDATGRAVRFRRDGQLATSLELELEDEAVEEVDVAVVPAGSVRARLACTDAQTIPTAVSVLAVVAGRDPSEYENEEDLVREAALREDELGLTGPGRDTFVVGPLEDGAYHLAARPVGFDRWTWALGTEQAIDAVAFQTSAGEETDLETIAVECGPAIRMSPIVSSGQPLPDLRERPRDGDPVSIHGVVLSGSGERRVERVRVEEFRDHLLLRDLPEGDATLELTLLNDYFLPTTRLTIAVDATLRRGRTLSISPTVAATGGIVNVRSAAGVAARLAATATEERVAEVTEGGARFIGVPEGIYRLEICADAKCAVILETLEAIEVRASETTTVATGS